MTIRVAARAKSTTPMLEVMMPAGAPSSNVGDELFSKKRTPMPTPPRGSGN